MGYKIDERPKRPEVSPEPGAATRRHHPLLDVSQIVEILVAHGFVGEVIGQTPDLVNDPVWLEARRSRDGAPFEYERIERGMEIAEWLKVHPDVTAFAILDDCSDMVGVKHRLVLTDPIVGLDDPDVERAKWMLGQGMT